MQNSPSRDFTTMPIRIGNTQRPFLAPDWGLFKTVALNLLKLFSSILLLIFNQLQYLPTTSEGWGLSSRMGVYPPPPGQVRTPARGIPGQVRMGGYPSQGGGGARPGSPPRDRTAHGVLDKWQLVCLLRSRRRTVLFYSVYSLTYALHNSQ